MKKQIDELQATPSKRVFYSIIVDYDLDRALCELVDNVLDVWKRSGSKKGVKVSIRWNGSDLRGFQRVASTFQLSPGN